MIIIKNIQEYIFVIGNHKNICIILNNAIRVLKLINKLMEAHYG